MVIQNMISLMLESLNRYAIEHTIEIPDRLLNPWPIEKPIHEDVKSSLAVEKILSVIDDDRMDILETLKYLSHYGRNRDDITLDGIAALSDCGESGEKPVGKYQLSRTVIFTI